jgi:hypothetical protein
MEEGYRSVNAMKPEPWIEHFRSTVGKSSTWSEKPRPIFLKQNRKNSGGDSARNLPLTVVSPIEQSTAMATAELINNTGRLGHSQSSSEPHKRKTLATAERAGNNSSKKKKRRKTIKGKSSRVKRAAKDIFSKT